LAAKELAKPTEKKFLKMRQPTKDLKVNGQGSGNRNERQESTWL
jgi:hypothetical protein